MAEPASSAVRSPPRWRPPPQQRPLPRRRSASRHESRPRRRRAHRPARARSRTGRRDPRPSPARARPAGVSASDTVAPVSGPMSVAGSRRPAAGQQLEGNRRQREHVGRRRPLRAGDPLGRAVRPPHRRAQTRPARAHRPRRSRRRAPRPGVTKMSRGCSAPWPTPAARAKSIASASWPTMRQHGVEATPARSAASPRRATRRRRTPRRDTRPCLRRRRRSARRSRDEQLGFGGVRQLVGQRLRLLGGDVETEDLDRDQPIARGLVGAEHRTERAHADLMQDPEGAERRRRSECGRIVSGQ